MPNDDLRNIIAVNHRDDKLVADCLDCIVAFPVAVQRMRAASDLATIPSLMRDNTQLSFDALRASNQDCALVASNGVDQLYRYIVALEVLDHYTRAYTEIAVREFFNQLTISGVSTFYILDNALRQDRFLAVLDLFYLAGINVFSPSIKGQSWEQLSDVILQCTKQIGAHVAYIEIDASVNYLDAATDLARSTDSIATFRNLAPEDPRMTLLQMPAKRR